MNLRRCPVLKQKILATRSFRATKCTLLQLKKRSNEWKEKSIETVLQEETVLLKFILNTDEIFVLNELISLFVNRQEFNNLGEKNKITIIVILSQIFLKRFLIPLVLKHELHLLHEILINKLN